MFSDSSFANAEGLRSQAGYLVFVTGDQVCSVEGDVATLVDWRSHKIKRQCRSTLAAETMSLDAAVDSGALHPGVVGRDVGGRLRSCAIRPIAS